MLRRLADAIPPARLNNNAAQDASLGAKVRLHDPADYPNPHLAEASTAAKRQVLTVMFVDIRGSSKIEEALSPELTIEFLNIYLGLAAHAILANKGGINQFIGDGILATFGLLNEPDHGAANAVAAAGAIHRAFESARARAASTEKVQAVVAIHTGAAIVHAISRAEQYHYGVLGAAVNTASRLEWEGKKLGLTTVLSGSTVSELNGASGSLRLVTRKKLRGLSDLIEVWSADPVGTTDAGDPIAAPPRLAVSAAARGAAEAGDIDWRPLASGTLTAGVFVASLAAIVWLRSGQGTSTSVLLNLLQVAAAIAASLTCGWTASRSSGHPRRGWTLIAASSGAWALGQIESSVLGLGMGLVPLSAWFADASFLASLTLAIAGTLCFWASPLTPSDRWRAVLDGMIVTTSLTFALWALGLKEVALWPVMSLSDVTDEVVFSVGEIVLGTVVILVINRGARHMRGPLLLLLTSIAAGATGAVLGAYQTKLPDEGVLVADAGLLLAFLLVALAPLWPVRIGALASEGIPDVWELALPWMAVLLAASGSVVLVLQGQGLDRFLTLLGAMLGALLAASQFFAHRDWLIMLGKSRLSEKTLADVIAHAPIGIARASTNLKVVAANPSLGMLLGEPPEVLTGSAIVNYVLPEIQPEVRRRLNALASGDAEIVESEIPMIRRDGNRAWVHLTSTAVKKPTGEVDYLLAMLKDETDRHEAEDVARTNLAELEHLSRMKSEFLQSISHEFRTALVGINGFSELMEVSTDIDPNQVREFARDISSGAERLSRMVTEFLELDHVETGPASVLLGPVDMNAIIRREIEQVRNETDGLTFTSILDPQLALMVGDESQLSQLVTVLLRNAVRYSPDGGRIIIATRTHVGRLELTVTDQGVGVRADFDNPLFSGDDLYANNPIRRVVGTGLGLGIARQIVAVHGGRIWMDRLDGVGSEAHVSFPVDMTAPRDGKSEPRVSAKAS